VAALGTGQPYVSAARLMGASFGDAETLVMSLVASMVLMVLLILVGGEVGRRKTAEVGNKNMRGH
jgi:hypothetical protein